MITINEVDAPDVYVHIMPQGTFSHSATVSCTRRNLPKVHLHLSNPKPVLIFLYSSLRFKVIRRGDCRITASIRNCLTTTRPSSSRNIHSEQSATILCMTSYL